MPLFQLRNRRSARSASIAKGRPTPLKPTFDIEARVKVVYAVGDHIPSLITPNYDLSRIDPDFVQQQQAAVLVRAWGKTSFGRSRDLRSFIASEATDAEVVDYIESWFPALTQLVAAWQRDPMTWPPESPAGVMVPLGDLYRDRINEILDDQEVAYQLVGTEMLPRESMAAHALIVSPVIALTSGRSDLRSVEKAYQDALREMKPGGDPADAITDAGTALQEMLKVAGAQGNALGPLVTDARRKDLFGPYDSPKASNSSLSGLAPIEALEEIPIRRAMQAGKMPGLQSGSPGH